MSKTDSVAQQPYHLILMMLLALIVIESERTILFSSQQCSSSYVSKVAPKVTMPKPPPKLMVNGKNNTSPLMCLEEEENENQTKDTEKRNISLSLEYNILMCANQAGVFLATIPAGWAAVCCSSHNVLLTGQLIMATATIMVPLVTNLYWILAVILEGLVGAGMAIMLPSVFTVMSDWEHVEWKTTIICLCLAGRPLGQLASVTLISVTCHWDFFPGWVLSHFIIGFLGLLWCALWLWFGHPKAPCAGCVYECCVCGNKEPAKVPICTKRLIMMKVWSAVAKQSAVWGIVFAWSATDLMWMLLETYVTVLNRINFMNEIWTSAALLTTCVMTVIAGIVADRIIDCNPESYRYIRKIFDSLGKVFVIILSIVMVRLQFNCTKWILVMSVIVIVTAIHSLQFAGCYSNSVDIGDPCTGVTVSMAMIFSSLSRLAMWNGLFYSVSFDMDLLRFQPPLYAISAILGASIVIYALFGSPDVNLYLPPNWDSLISSHASRSSCCTTNKSPHNHIIHIMDQACRTSESHQGSTVQTGVEYNKQEDLALYDDRPRDSVVSFSESPTLRKSSLPTASILRRSHSPLIEPRVQFIDNQRSPVSPLDSSMTDLQPDPNDMSNQTTTSTVRPKVPTVRLEETNDNSDWPPPPTFQSIRDVERRSPRLQRGDAVDAGDEAMGTTPEQPWLRAESQL